MKAATIAANGAPMVIKEVPVPELKDNEVLVKLEYSSLNRRDLSLQKGSYAGGGPATGLILGSDGSGKVSATGNGADPALLGKDVIINPSHNWGDKQEAFGSQFKILGNPDNGTFAEYIAVDQRYIYQKPSHLTDEEAAALPLAGLTTYRAVFIRAQVKKGEKVLITGIGAGTALLALNYALCLGADVYVTSGSDDKISKAIGLGATGGANYKEDEWTKKLQQQSGGFDVVLDSASGKGFPKLLQVTNPGGRVVFWGGTGGPISDIIPRDIYWKNISVLGTTMGSDDNFKEMLAFVETNKIRPVIDKVFLSLDQAQEAFDYMAKGEQFGKIVLKNI